MLLKSEKLKDQLKSLDHSTKLPLMNKPTKVLNHGSDKMKDQLSFHSMTELLEKSSVKPNQESVYSTKKDPMSYSTLSLKVLKPSRDQENN